MESGKILRMEFTQFSVYVSGAVDNCTGDHVKITDGDGTTLMDKSCGDSSPSSSDYFLPPIFTSNTNAVKIFFRTDGRNTRPGWSLSWGAVTPGVVTSTYDCLSDPSSIQCTMQKLKNWV